MTSRLGDDIGAIKSIVRADSTHILNSRGASIVALMDCKTDLRNTEVHSCAVTQSRGAIVLIAGGECSFEGGSFQSCRRFGPATDEVCF